MVTLVPRRGLEPPPTCVDYPLKVARLPIPPPGQISQISKTILRRKDSTKRSQNHNRKQSKCALMKIMNNSKQQIRKTILAKRRALSPEKAAQFSKQIITKLLTLPEFQKAKTILLYNPMDNEVDTTPLFAPPNTQTTKEIHFPTPSPTDPQPPYDLVVTPGIAFDENLDRIGYGKGYFDRLFRNLSTDCVKIALAYDFQIVENVPAEEHDQKVDLILTEQRKITPPTPQNPPNT